MRLNEITLTSELQRLVAELFSSSRKKPICVLTLPFHSDVPAVDLSDLEEAADACDFYLLTTSDLTREFEPMLPPNTHAYNGAIRVYPAGFTSETPAYSLPLFQPHANNRRKLAEDVMAEIWTRADLSELKAVQVQRAKPAKGKITGFFPARAWVQLDSGDIATIRQEVSFPGVPLEWLYKKGDKVTGRFAQTDGAFIPDSAERTLADVFDLYGVNNIALALVTEAGRQRGKVKLLPNVEVEITRDEISGNPRDLVEDLLEIGEVVPVRLYRDPQGRSRVRMDDIDDDEQVLPALPLVEGGEPWLIEGRDVPNYVPDEPEISTEDSAPIEFEPIAEELPAPAASSTATSPIPLPGPGKLPGLPTTGQQPAAPAGDKHLEAFAASQYRKQLEVANARLKAMTDLANSYKTKWDGAEADLRSRRSSVSPDTRKSEKKAKREAARSDNRSTTWSRRDRWETDQDWFREELRRLWISGYAASERREKYGFEPTTFSFGPEFFASLRDVAADESVVRKVVRTVLDIVTGREADARRHEVHPLRDGLQANPDPVLRGDGAESFRAYVEQMSASARRLHFWKFPDNRIELSRVVRHDDYKP